MDNFFLWLAYHFNSDMFLKSTYIQGIFWSIADFSLVYGFLRLASFARDKSGKGKTPFRYILFWVAAILNPYFLFYQTGTKHDLLIFGVFLLLIYAAAFDGLRILKLIKGILPQHQSSSRSA